MNIVPQMSGNILYMQLQGEIDEHNAAQARQQADRLAETYAYQSARAVFDLAEVAGDWSGWTVRFDDGEGHNRTLAVGVSDGVLRLTVCKPGLILMVQ